MRKTLLTLVVSWNRPHFLAQTLESLKAQLSDIEGDLIVVDNGSDFATQQVIRNAEFVTNAILLEDNVGINAAIERALPDNLREKYEFILISDADMEYRLPLTIGIQALRLRPTLGAISYQNSPEHPVLKAEEIGGQTFLLKSSERGCSLLMRTSQLSLMRPLPVKNFKDFDWWVCRDCPQSFQNRNKQIAALPMGAIHLGWRKGDSTWQDQETPEYHLMEETLHEIKHGL